MSELITALEKALELAKAEKSQTNNEAEFIRDEWVEVRDYGHQQWLPRKFCSYINDDNSRPYLTGTDDGTIGWRQCRLPQGVPNIFIRHVGGKCPEPPETEVVIFQKNGRIGMGPAKIYSWRHIKDDNTNILGYMILKIPQGV